MDLKEFQAGQKLNINSNHPWEMARETIIRDIVSKFLPKRTITGIDLGCGDIFFLSQFSQKIKGIFFAVDIAFTDEIIEKLNLKYNNTNIKLHNSLDSVHINHKVDIIFIMDVIEHIDNPVDFIKTIVTLNYIDNNTIFLITVPAYQCLFSNHDKWIEHKKRYSPKLLKKEVFQAGLQVIDSGSFFSTLILPRLTIRTFEKIRKSNFENSTGVGGWNYGKVITNCIRIFLKMDYYFFGKFLKKIGVKLPGLSLYVVCKLNNKE